MGPLGRRGYRHIVTHAHMCIVVWPCALNAQSYVDLAVLILLPTGFARLFDCDLCFASGGALCSQRSIAATISCSSCSCSSCSSCSVALLLELLEQLGKVRFLAHFLPLRFRWRRFQTFLTPFLCRNSTVYLKSQTLPYTTLLWPVEATKQYNEHSIFIVQISRPANMIWKFNTIMFY